MFINLDCPICTCSGFITIYEVDEIDPAIEDMIASILVCYTLKYPKLLKQLTAVGLPASCYLEEAGASSGMLQHSLPVPAPRICRPSSNVSTVRFVCDNYSSHIL